jgi:pimeloyl-ACP methyl ester carboxylesterase
MPVSMFGVWIFTALAILRYPQMYEPPADNAPLCVAEDAAKQLEAAVRFILDYHTLDKISLIAHSWGSMPLGRFASEHSALVDRMIQFAPIARRKARRHFENWGKQYLDSDPESRSRDPAGVKTPLGLFSEIIKAWHGQLAYDPALMRSPVAIIRGEWDGLMLDEDAHWLFNAFTQSPDKRDIKIGRGTALDAPGKDANGAMAGKRQLFAWAERRADAEGTVEAEANVFCYF